MEPSIAKLRYCYKCGFQASTAEPKCPRCRGPLQASSGVRIRGVIMIALGGFLIAFMSWLTILVMDAAKPNAEGGPSFTGTDDQLLAVLAFFALLIVFGFATALAGSWQVIFGRRNKFIVWGVVGFAVLMAVMANFVYLRLD